MTVKIAKIFYSSAGGVKATNATPATDTPTSASQKYTYHRQQQQQPQQQYQLHKQQQQQSLHCNLYMDDEDDNMSLYSTTASIMTTRDHPFNNSQRPLLPDKKNTTQVLAKKKQQQHHRHQQQQQQQHQYYKYAETYYYQQQHQQQHHQSPYISPFVQQQKRDTAKGLHGFNDFDILSQQYNQHLQSPHLGYPYGSPPSPTATASAFAFDAQAGTPPASKSLNCRVQRALQAQQQRTTTTSTPLYGNLPPAVPPYSPEPLTGYSSPPSNGPCFMGKASRFEDDFCCRRNVEFSKAALQPSSAAVATTATTAATASSSSCSSVSSGPFIFGVPHEQQRDRLPASRVLVGEHDFGADCLVEPAPSSDSGVSVAGDSGPSLTHLSSDTSSSSRDSNSNSNNSKGIAAKLLLRKYKAKKKKKEGTKHKTSAVERTHPEKAAKQQTIKCVVVGDGAVGKTNLILSYLENRYIPEHIPTASDIYNADVMVNDSPVHLTLCDTAGQDTLDPLRELCYPDSDVFLLCFSVAKPETFHAIKTKWAPKFSGTKAALILVGTQADLRTDTEVLNKLETTGEKPISYTDAWDLATTIGAKYIETSSATQEKVKDVFDTAIWEALRPTCLPPTPPLWKKLLCLA